VNRLADGVRGRSRDEQGDRTCPCRGDQGSGC
jgi:hypothetical protein